MVGDWLELLVCRLSSAQVKNCFVLFVMIFDFSGFFGSSTYCECLYALGIPGSNT